jgi:flagellar hook-associated protein 2
MFSGSASVAGVASTAVSITTSSTSIQGSFTIDNVDQLATKDKYESTSEVIGDITSSGMVDFGVETTAYDANKQLSFTLDGVTKTITLDVDLAASVDENNDIAANISLKLQEAFTNVDIQVDFNGTELEFNIYTNGTVDNPGPYVDGDKEIGHTFSVGTTNSDLLTDLGLESGQSNYVDITQSLEDVFNITANEVITINGEAFSVTKDTTVSEFMSAVNSSEAGVTINYDSFNDKFSLESNSVGTDNTITVSETGTLMATMQLTDATTNNTAAQNAEFTVNGVVTTRSSNTFTMNGTEVTINDIPASVITIGVETDTTDVKDLIVNFVEKYNEMIEKINDELSDDIEAWENEARKGGLRNDNVLESLTLNLRKALYESVEDMGISLADIGIQSSSNYKDAGKLVIDEIKLDAALESRPNEIIELFTKQSSTTYSSYTNKSTRYSENGLSARISDILQDNIRITRDNNGQKGYLLEKAGFETGVDATSDMAKKILEMDETIADLLEMLADKEDKYYADFARMESAMSSYSSQSSWLTSQFGG